MNTIKYVLCCVLLYSFAHGTSNHRNMIILLNQEDNCENIGNPYWHFLSCKFQSALQEKCSPILINASLINAFIEKRKSIQQMSQLKGSEEEKALNTYKAIHQQLNASYASLRARGINPLQAKQLMLDEVNQKFYTPQAVLKSRKKPISNHVEQALRAYETQFNADEWGIYTNNKSLYLFVPNANKEQIEGNQSGLKLAALTKVENIQDVVKLYFDSKQENKYPIAQQLQDFFITQSDSSYRPYCWNIVFSGHGGTRYVEKTDAYSQATIADLSIFDFQQVLAFFQNEIKTHSFHYATCFGSGKRFQLVFDKVCYDFPIISDCTSDGETFCMVRNFKLPHYDGRQLEEHDINIDKEGNWNLNLDYGYNWREYFNQISQQSFNDNDASNLCQLYNILNHITENMISNIPQIRLPHATSFIPALSNNTTIINDAFIAYHQEQPHSAYTLTDRFAILVKSSCITFPLIFDNEHTMPHIISLIPGPSKQYFKKLVFKNFEHALNGFWPVPGDRFDRYFLAENVTFNNDNQAEILKKLDITSPTATVSHVLIHAQAEKILRIFFQTTDGISFMVVANKTDVFAQNVSLKGVHQLTPEVAQIYLSRYNQIKSELKMV